MVRDVIQLASNEIISEYSKILDPIVAAKLEEQLIRLTSGPILILLRRPLLTNKIYKISALIHQKDEFKLN